MQPLVEPGTSHTRPKQVSYRPARSSLGCTLRVLIQVQTLCIQQLSVIRRDPRRMVFSDLEYDMGCPRALKTVSFYSASISPFAIPA